MFTKKISILLLAALLIITGCPYNSALPPDAVGKPVDAGYAGKWICTDKNYDIDSMQIETNENTSCILIWGKQTKRENVEPVVYDCWQTIMLGKTIIYLGYKPKSKTSYLMYSASLKTENGTKTIISNEIPADWFANLSFTNTTELRQLLSRNIQHGSPLGRSAHWRWVSR